MLWFTPLGWMFAALLYPHHNFLLVSFVFCTHTLHFSFSHLPLMWDIVLLYARLPNKTKEQTGMTFTTPPPPNTCFLPAPTCPLHTHHLSSLSLSLSLPPSLPFSYSFSFSLSDRQDLALVWIFGLHLFLAAAFCIWQALPFAFDI